MDTSEMPKTPFHAVTQAAEAAVDRLLVEPSNVLLACDFDGTLAPIVDDPQCSRMVEPSRAALARLGPRLGGLAIITGRPVMTVRELGALDGQPGFERLWVLGQYGQEVWDAGSGQLDIPPAPESIAAAKSDLEALLAAPDAPDFVRGTALEDKGRAIGVHTRRALDPDAALEWLADPVQKIAAVHDLPLEPGRQVIELRSATTTKGDALAGLVERLDPQVVVMIGDDLGDLPAFDYVAGLSESGRTGLRVVSASAEQPRVAEEADVWCDGPDGVAAWLTWLADRLDG